MTIFEKIAEHAHSAGLDFLLIGGYAVAGHGYPRFTADVDLMIEENQIAPWQEWLSGLGYTIYHRLPNFLQWCAPQGLPPVDLILVDAATFLKLKAGAVQLKVGGVNLPSPKVEHVVALKLHATKSRRAEDAEKDWLDIFQLMKLHNLRLSTPEFRAIIAQHGGEKAVEKIRKVFGE